DTALLRLGWWSRAGGHPLEAVNAYRALLRAYPRTTEAPWARVGLVQALLDLDDYHAAREEARRLESDKSALSLSTLLMLRHWLTGKPHPDEARALDDELLARQLQPGTRAWVLLVSADSLRQAEQLDEARNRFDLVRQSPASALYRYHATFLLAQLDFG